MQTREGHPPSAREPAEVRRERTRMLPGWIIQKVDELAATMPWSGLATQVEEAKTRMAFALAEAAFSEPAALIEREACARLAEKAGYIGLAASIRARTPVEDASLPGKNGWRRS